VNYDWSGDAVAGYDFALDVELLGGDEETDQDERCAHNSIKCELVP
jgi:hypothetical protein